MSEDSTETRICEFELTTDGVIFADFSNICFEITESSLRAIQLKEITIKLFILTAEFTTMNNWRQRKSSQLVNQNKPSRKSRVSENWFLKTSYVLITKEEG